MTTSHQDLTSATADRGAQEPKSKARTAAGRLVGFTNNLLATSVVVIVALTVGNQLIALWSQTDSSLANDTAAVSDWPETANCAIEFGDHPYSLTRRQFRGDHSQAVQELSLHCQRILETSPDPSGPLGENEAKMIRDAKQLVPISAQPGEWRLFQVKSPHGDQLPMVIGLRDNCDLSSGENRCRMVTWGLATPVGESHWTLFISTSNPGGNAGNATSRFDEFVPTSATKSLGIRNDNGSELLGFSGGELSQVKQFYRRLARQNDWEFSWEESTIGWQCQLTQSNRDDRTVRIQLTLDANKKLRGLIFFEAKTIEGSTE